MPRYLHSLIIESAKEFPEKAALSFKDKSLTYGDLEKEVLAAAIGLKNLGVGRSERVGVYLPKLTETVITIFAASASGAVFVPVNPLLKGSQVEYILRDCNVRTLVTQSQRLDVVTENLHNCPDLHTVICIDKTKVKKIGHIQVVSWAETMSSDNITGESEYSLKIGRASCRERV